MTRFLADERDLVFRAWDDADEVVVYHRPSGETHLLNPVAASALRAIARGPCSLHDLCEAVAREFDAEDPAAYRASLAALLDHLVDLGLVRPEARS